MADIEAVSSKKRIDNPYDRYAHLLNEMNELLEETNEYLQNAKNLDIEEITLSVCSKDREIQFGRKVAHLCVRALLHQALNDDSNQKADIFRDPKGLYLDTAAVIFQVAGVCFGPIFEATGKAFSTSSQYDGKAINSSVTRLEHNYQRMRDLVSDHSQQMQSAEREYDQNEATINRMMQTYERMSQLMVGG